MSFTLSPLNQRRWNNFKSNRRAFWSLVVFSILFGLSLLAEFIANDKPILVQYRGEYYAPIFQFYPETAFGGDFKTEAVYRDPEVKCLIRSGGIEDCFDDPEGIIAAIDAGSFGIGDDSFHKGWALWPVIPYSFTTPVDRPGAAPLPPNSQNWLGTDDTKRDVVARVIYGFRLSIVFTLIVTTCASLIGIAAGAAQGYFGGRLDLVFQRVIEIWGGDAIALYYHYFVCDTGSGFLASGVFDGAVWLDCAGWGCAGRVFASPQSGICARGTGAGCV